MIAIFDSGYGGLTVLKPIKELLPEYDYIYFGDNARAPYGNKDSETIKTYAEESIDCLLKNGAELILFACNTVSGVALRHVQQKHEKTLKSEYRRILGLLIPVAEYIPKQKNIRVGIIGTKATVDSKVYMEEISKTNPSAKFFSKACPLLTPLIEENWHTKPEASSILKKYLLPLKSHNLDVLIIGCTHYTLMLPQIKRIMGKKVKIINPGEITAQSLKDYLKRHPELEKKLTKSGSIKFLTTKDPEEFKRFAEKYMGTKISPPKKITI